MTKAQCGLKAEGLSLRTGLGASIWSKGLKRAEKMARQLSVGSFCVNLPFDHALNVSFGGHKESDIGMEWDIEGLKHNCGLQQKYCHS